jgi:hypothetical protein
VKKPLFLSFLIIFLVVAAAQSVFSQNNKRVIQLSGVVLSSDSTGEMLPGVNIYVPKAGRGTNTNGLGFFSMPVLVGDSLIVSYVGYERQFYIVPNHPSEFLTVVVQMDPDVTYLKEIEIMPFPTEEVFKEAVLALNITTEQAVDPRSMNQELLAMMMRTTPMDGPMNQRYQLSQWAASQGNQYAPVQNPLFNPFNWARFFRSLKQNKK